MTMNEMHGHVLYTTVFQARGSYYWCWHGDVLADTFRRLWVELGSFGFFWIDSPPHWAI